LKKRKAALLLGDRKTSGSSDNNRVLDLGDSIVTDLIGADTEIIEILNVKCWRAFANPLMAL
jgi:hypothetical protein